MQTLARTEQMTPATTEWPASRSVSGVLALEGGLVVRGRLRGAPLAAEGDLIFATAGSGWAEILTDPSYAGQLVVLTHPMAGNYRLDPSEFESDRVHARGLVVTRLVTPARGDGRTLEDVAAEAGIPILEGIDTRAVTLALRRGARRRAVVLAGDPTSETAIEAAKASPRWESIDFVAAVSTPAAYRVPATAAPRAEAVVVDFGVKRALLRALAARGLTLSVLPHTASAADVAGLDPDLVVLSPGPGDPSRMAQQIAVVRDLVAVTLAGGPPILGVCLGHQLLALAAGAQTRRLAVGHHGGNHAVIELGSGRVDIGAHNHEVEVLDGPALTGAGYAVSHRDLNDGTVEGLVHRSGRIASVQFHPEGAPGPTDAERIFDLAIASTARIG